MRRGAAALVLAAAVACARPAPPASPAEARAWPTPPAGAVHARVSRIVDGDTIVLQGIDTGAVDHTTGGHRARLIGIDTPEIHGRVDCYGREAAAFTQSVLLGRDVLVDFDVEPTDRYGRALVYVWQGWDRVLFNARLADEGYALQLTIPPDVRYAELFGGLVRHARDAHRGLWGPACERS